MNSKVGLAVMRIQPMHSGHCMIINKMIQECEMVILGLGSTNKKPDRWDPFTPDVRMQMVRNVYGDRVKIVPLVDIQAASKSDWVNYILSKLEKLGMRKPTDYFTGSISDAAWYTDHFVLDLVTKNPTVHMVDRGTNDIPSASELRTLIELRNDKWKQWVPSVNWDLVLDNYPEELLAPLT